MSLPLIALLSAEELEGVETRVIGGAAVGPVVLMVGDQVGVDARLLEQLGHGVVKGFEGSPAAVQEVVSTRVQLASGRHTWHGSAVGIVEGDGPLGEVGEVRRDDLGGPIGREEAPIEGVEEDEDRTHVRRPT